ncbi:tropomyosin-like [Pocillopora verrucosa]|uniref:tropomyosin-like n=1 Tax=Pocillopora verrucosa TaxID=203993 RepID=UPI0033412173
MSTNTSSSNPQYFRADQARFPRDRSARDSASSGRLQSREREIKALKDEIEKLRENEERNHAKIKALERKIEELETQKRILEEQLDMVRKRVDALEEVQVSLLLATMCDEIQNMMFKRIFPQRFNPKVQRKVKDIEDMLRTSGNREKRLWASLQAELNWKYCHLDAVKSLKRVRNKRAHPVEKLTEEALRVSVQKMTEEDFFEEDNSWLSVEVINELITMWKQLREKH